MDITTAVDGTYATCWPAHACACARAFKDGHTPRFQQKMVSEVGCAQNPARDPILAGI